MNTALAGTPCTRYRPRAQHRPWTRPAGQRKGGDGLAGVVPQEAGFSFSGGNGSCGGGGCPCSGGGVTGKNAVDGSQRKKVRGQRSALGTEPCRGSRGGLLEIIHGRSRMTVKGVLWGGAYSRVGCLGHLATDHASLSRRSTVFSANRDTSSIWALNTFFPHLVR